jgi:hypothetical protein
VRTDHELISPDGRFRSIHDRHNFDRGPTITVVATERPTCRYLSHFIFAAGFNVIQDQEALFRVA